MGIAPASAAFQGKMIRELQGLQGVDVIQDDCLVEGYGGTEVECMMIILDNVYADVEKVVYR